MSFPAPESAWPPPALSPLLDTVGEAAAWWQGDVGKLSGHYGGGAQYRPSQFSGGVVGAVSRFFWGTPPADGDTGQKLHLPLAGDIAATSASLLFETPPTFRVAEDGGNDAAQDRLDEMMNSDQLAADLLVAGESCAALGGVYGRVMWDQSVSEHPWIDWVDTDSAIPEWRYGKLQAVSFVEELPKIDKHVWRLFTRYSPGRIEYQLYQGDASTVGKVQPLPDHPTTAGIQVDMNSGVDTGTTGLAAAYFPNARPFVQFRGNGQLRPHGRPDLAPDLFPLFDFLDETWTSLQREIRVSKARITVPEYMLDQRGMGQGQSFNPDRTVYSPLNAPRDAGMMPEFHQPDIRADKLLTAADATVREVLRRTNYSPSTFGLDTEGSGAMTAREIESRDKASIQTWKAKSRYFKSGLGDLAVAMIQVDDMINGTRAELTASPVVDMAPPVQETVYDRALTVQALDTARAISTGEKVRMLHPEWDDTRTESETAAIIAEQGGTFDPLGNVDPDEPLEL